MPQAPQQGMGGKGGTQQIDPTMQAYAQQLQGTPAGQMPPQQMPPEMVAQMLQQQQYFANMNPQQQQTAMGGKGIGMPAGQMPQQMPQQGMGGKGVGQPIPNQTRQMQKMIRRNGGR